VWLLVVVVVVIAVRVERRHLNEMLSCALAPSCLPHHTDGLLSLHSLCERPAHLARGETADEEGGVGWCEGG
jgi:hypothetical protein